MIVALQLGWAGQGRADAAGAYFCNPGGQPPNAEALAQIRDLFAAAGKVLPEDAERIDHCPDCLVPSLGDIPTLNLEPVARDCDMSLYFTSLSLGVHYSAQGPPLGSRAPPFFA